MWLIDESSLNLCVKSLIDFGVKEARFLVLYLNRYFLQKNTKTRDLDALEVTIFVK